MRDLKRMKSRKTGRKRLRNSSRAHSSRSLSPGEPYSRTSHMPSTGGLTGRLRLRSRSSATASNIAISTPPKAMGLALIRSTSWAHSWAQRPADRRNQTLPDAKGPVVFLGKDGQIQPDATRRRTPGQFHIPEVTGSSPVPPIESSESPTVCYDAVGLLKVLLGS